MTPEERQILLIDLCARLPYRPNGVKLNKFGDEDITVTGYTGRFVETLDDEVEVERVRLYLRPISSMTEDEEKEFLDTCYYSENDDFYYSTCETYDWYNKNHFDYRGLIPMDLAIEASADMYNTK